jgi:nucleotide sugar dehydrogenase
MRVTVVGLGKIGLPLAVQIAGSGIEVAGADISRAVVDHVNRGSPPFPGEAHLDDRLAAVVADGRLRATIDTTAAVASSEVTIIVVPLVVDDEGTPDFTGIDAATRAVASGLEPGHLVSYETTLPIGATRQRFAPALAAGSGLEAGTDFNLVHSPERVFSGRIFADLRRYPKLVGGITPACNVAGVAFYERVLAFDARPDLDRPNGVWDLGPVENAEFTKLAETTYRDVNIALANEFAVYAERAGLDVATVIEAANSQPFSHIHRPGISVGGHCIPVYPMFYLAGDPTATLPRAARAVNLGMPRRAIDRLAGELGELSGRHVAVLGAAYRPGVKETAFSGVFDLVAGLSEKGASVSVHDPLYSEGELAALGFTAYRIGEPVDAVILHTDHPEYSSLGPADLPGVEAIVDGRAALNPDVWHGVHLIAVGR